MRLIVLTAALFAATTAAAAPTPAAAPPAAETPTPRGDAIAKLMAADTDKDGRWSKAEWTAAGRRDRGFSFLDADKDGMLTEAELRSGMERMRARRGAAQ